MGDLAAVNGVYRLEQASQNVVKQEWLPTYTKQGEDRAASHTISKVTNCVQNVPVLFV